MRDDLSSNENVWGLLRHAAAHVEATIEPQSPLICTKRTEFFYSNSCNHNIMTR